jgi:hypothetical protein
MSLGAGIAIAGIWIGVALLMAHGQGLLTIALVCGALIATDALLPR